MKKLITATIIVAGIAALALALCACAGELSEFDDPLHWDEVDS